MQPKTIIRIIGLLIFGYTNTSLATNEVIDQPRDDLIREEIIITAERSETKLKDSGSSVSVVTASDIANTNAIFATQLLQGVAGLSISQSGPTGSASQIRIRGAEGNHTLVLIDGINVNDPAISSEFNFADLMLSDSDQIEIVKGTQTVLYGSNTIGGVINIRTPTPRVQGVHGYIDFKTGNNDTNYQAIKLNARGHKSYGVANISRYSTDGSNASLLGSEKDGYSTENILLKYGVDLSPTLNTTAFLRRTNSQSQTDPQDFSYPATPTQGLVIDGNEHSETSQEHRGVFLDYQSVNKPITSLLRMQSTRTQSRFFQEDHYALGNRGARDKLDWYSTIEVANKSTRHRLGLLLIHEKLKFLNYSQNYPAANYQENLDQSSLAGLYHLSMSKTTHLNISMRRDYNSCFEDANSFSASLSHLFNDGNTRLHTTLGTGLTNPSFIEIFGYAPSNFEGNPSLDPEKSVSLDLGVEHSLFSNKSLIDLTLFSARLKDEIITVFDAQSFMSKSANDNQPSTRAGLELSVMSYFQENWRLATTYTHLKAEDGNNLEEIRRPRHKASINLNYRSNNEKTNINVGVILNGEQRDLEFIASTPETTALLPAYQLININISHTFSNKLTAHLKIRNLMDSEYSDVFSYRGPRRSITAGLGYKF